MDNRLLLDKIDYEKGTITIDGKTYELLDSSFRRSTRQIRIVSPRGEHVMRRCA